MLSIFARCVPSTSTFTVPSGNFSICRIFATAITGFAQRGDRVSQTAAGIAIAAASSIAAPVSSAEDAAHAEQLLERLNVSLSELSNRQQQIFILSRLHGHSYLEIAEKHHLLVTGGSDCHGFSKKAPLIGTVRVPFMYVEKLYAAKKSADEKRRAAAK